jgi:predicted ArsR family transcriptional regulator
MHLNPQQSSTRRRRGQKSRDRILASLKHQPDQSRDQLMQSAKLTYDQVRDQTRNLCVEGLILSYVGSRGERRYALRQNRLQWPQASQRPLPHKTSA